MTHVIYVKSSFINIQKQWNKLKISLLLKNLQVLRVKNSRILRFKNAKFSIFNFAVYMNTNTYIGRFSILHISVPLSLIFIRLNLRTQTMKKDWMLDGIVFFLINFFFLLRVFTITQKNHLNTTIRVKIT